MEYIIKNYTEEEKESWDQFVLSKSMNGTFLQTRRFLEYHKPGKFTDCSMMIYKGKELVAVIPACEIKEEDKKIFFSHKGSTYGGIVVSTNVYSATMMNDLVEAVETYIKGNGFDSIYFKNTSNVYSKMDTSLLDYFLYKDGYFCHNELNYYMHLNRYKTDILTNFSSNKRRDYRYSLKQELTFKKLTTKEQIAEFYNVLQLNLKKLNLTSVHSLEDLYDLKFNRFDQSIEFYGVYLDTKMIAGSMVFIINDKIFHTQYLSSDENYLKMYPMDFLIYHLIDEAVKMEKEIFSFGICTEDQGKYLNLGLSRFKEGFGAEFSISKSYEKQLTN